MSDARPPERPASPFLILLLGAATTALATEWLRFQAGWTLAAAPVALGAPATLVAVARTYRARRRWRRAREAAAAGEPSPSVPEAEAPPPRVQARPARQEPRPSVLRHDAPASLLGPNDLDAARADARADAMSRERTTGRQGRGDGARDRVETD
jgi:hypothetical protein